MTKSINPRSDNFLLNVNLIILVSTFSFIKSQFTLEKNLYFKSQNFSAPKNNKILNYAFLAIKLFLLTNIRGHLMSGDILVTVKV